MKLVDVYIYRLIENEPQFFLFQRSDKQIYAQQWRMIGGKVGAEETFWQAALREFTEETKLLALHFWTLPSVNTFYEPQSDTIHHIPAFAIQVAENALPILNHEHKAFGVFGIEEACNLLQWSEQKRLLKLAHELIVENKILSEWEVL